MNVPLLDLKPQLEVLRSEILDAVTSVIDSTGYILGPIVERFENEVAEYTGSKFGVGVSSGTDALLAALMSLDVGVGDRVLTTPYTFFATMGTILRTGATPVFVDIEKDSFNIDPNLAADALQKAVGSSNPIKAIMPVHLYGQCADMQPLLALSKQYSIPIIEDAAQAIGAEYPLQKDGSIEWQRAGSMGLAGCFSFFPSKNLGGIGDGGMITTSDKEYAAILRFNRNHGAEPKYYHSRIGGNFRLDTIQAAVLSVKLKHLQKWHQARRKNAAIYSSLFADAGLVDEPVQLPKTVYSKYDDHEQHNHHIYNQYIIKVPQRDTLREHLANNSIGSEIYYPLCLHQQECVAGTPSIAKQHFPVAEDAAATSLALPIYPELSEEQLEYVVRTIKKFYH